MVIDEKQMDEKQKVAYQTSHSHSVGTVSRPSWDPQVFNTIASLLKQGTDGHLLISNLLYLQKGFGQR